MQARTQLAAAPLLVAQLRALEFRNKLIQGGSKILRSLRLGTMGTMAELLKNLSRAPALSVLQLCFGDRNADFADQLLQHADNLDFVQDVLSATGNSAELNPILNGVLAGFNRRRRYRRFKYGHHSLDIDRLRFASTKSANDNDFCASEILSMKKEKRNNG